MSSFYSATIYAKEDLKSQILDLEREVKYWREKAKREATIKRVMLFAYEKEIQVLVHENKTLLDQLTGSIKK